jgi:hypothetical protein
MADALSIVILVLLLVAVLLIPGRWRWRGRPWFVTREPQRRWLAAFFGLLLVAAVIKAIV